MGTRGSITRSARGKPRRLRQAYTQIPTTHRIFTIPVRLSRRKTRAKLFTRLRGSQRSTPLTLDILRLCTSTLRPIPSPGKRVTRITGPPQRLVNVLPRSIEQIVIVSPMDMETIESMLDGLVEGKAQRLPLLQSIISTVFFLGTCLKRRRHRPSLGSRHAETLASVCK